MRSFYYGGSFRSAWAAGNRNRRISAGNRNPEIVAPLRTMVPRILAEAKLDEFVSMAASSGGDLEIFVHDFRNALPNAEFDRIINMKAIQALNESSMKRAAAVHWSALRPGGDAVFVTQNIQGKHRTVLESTLVNAGFYVPCYEVNVWHREMLDSTGVDYVMILDQPKARMVSTERNRVVGQAKLDAFQPEWYARLEEAQSRSVAIQSDGVSKLAQIIYNTG
jgi:hypothetical protein